MSDIIRFEPNVPVTVQLKFPEGKEVEGRFGPQFYFSTPDERCFYVDPPIAARIHALRLSAGDWITIEKRPVTQGRKKGIEWVIIERAAQPVTQTPAAAIAPQPHESNGAQSTTTPNILTRQMAGALCSAIDAVRLAADYAASKGLKPSIDLVFNGEDVRTLANAAMIQMQRDYENALKYRNVPPNGNGYVNGHVNGQVSGGSAWPLR